MVDYHKNIYWIASFPKSGSTWFRIFLSNLISNTKTPININNINSTLNASNRNYFDTITGLSSSDLSASEILSLRPQVYQSISNSSQSNLYIKVHDIWEIIPGGFELFPSNITLGVIYIVRNPLDVVISLARHNNITIKKAVSFLNSIDFYIPDSDSKLTPQLRQHLSSWSNHVKSWLIDSNFKIHVIRYEDMISKPHETFTSAARYLGLKKNRSDIEKAIRFSSFKEIQMQEQRFGFREKPMNSNSFFNTGSSGQWKIYLDKKMINAIKETNQEMMEYLYYLID